MEEKTNYVVHTNGNSYFSIEKQERIVKMSAAQADAIKWFMNICDIDGCVEVAEEYGGEEI